MWVGLSSSEKNQRLYISCRLESWCYVPVLLNTNSRHMIWFIINCHWMWDNMFYPEKVEFLQIDNIVLMHFLFKLLVCKKAKGKYEQYNIYGMLSILYTHFHIGIWNTNKLLTYQFLLRVWPYLSRFALYTNQYEIMFRDWRMSSISVLVSHNPHTEEMLSSILSLPPCHCNASSIYLQQIFSCFFYNSYSLPTQSFISKIFDPFHKKNVHSLFV